jgi:uncharacterized protein (DUF2236 family)
MELYLEDGRRRLRFRVRPLLVAASAHGLFRQDSVIRRLYSDASVYFGAGRALLLQIAHPKVAAGVSEHSDYERRPLDRLFGTLYATNTVVFGSRRDAAKVAAAIRRIHERVTGPGYRALDPALLCWVNATLADTAIELYQRLVRPLSPPELDEFIASSRVVGEMFGCPLEEQPATWAEFRLYWDRMIASLEVTNAARRVCESLMEGRGLPLRPLWLPLIVAHRSVTAALLPARIRRGFGLPWGAGDRAMAELILGAASVILPRMPERVRQIAPEVLLAPARSRRETILSLVKIPSAPTFGLEVAVNDSRQAEAELRPSFGVDSARGFGKSAAHASSEFGPQQQPKQ